MGVVSWPPTSWTKSSANKIRRANRIEGIIPGRMPVHSLQLLLDTAARVADAMTLYATLEGDLPRQTWRLSAGQKEVP